MTFSYLSGGQTLTGVVYNGSDSQRTTQSLSQSTLTQLTTSVDKQAAPADKPDSTRDVLVLRRRDLEVMDVQLTLQHKENIGHLVELDLSRNRLTDLPDAVGDLRQLKMLNVAHNQLREIPPVVLGLWQLEILTVSENQITALPESMPQDLPNLVRLSADNNRIDSLPSRVDKWRKMQYLQLGSDYGGNQIRQLPESLADMPALLELCMTHNQLCQLPRLPPTLVRLDVNHNQLACLQLGDLAMLETIHAAHNQLTRLHHFSNCPCLVWLDVSQNQLSVLPSSLLDNPNLHIFLQGNPVDRCPDPGDLLLQLPSLQELALRKAIVHRVPFTLAPHHVAEKANATRTCYGCRSAYHQASVSSILFKAYRGRPHVGRTVEFCTSHCAHAYARQLQNRPPRRQRPPSLMMDSIEWIVAAAEAAAEQQYEELYL